MSFAIGENVGPYRILEQLGQGGMATVFKAYHAALDRYVAIKVLHPAFKADPNFIARFQREAKVVARMEHPHIVPVYDYAEHNGQPYLVMKYIEGETLKARLNERPLTREEAVGIAEAVGGALSYAHKQGVLHRDIKPSNVLLSGDGSIYLADFGLARIAQAGASTLSKDVMMGTPQYISPEQAQGLHKLDEGTDIYSMGVVLYELVVGRVPFNADTPFSIIHDHIYTPLPLPSKVNPKVPARVERVLLKALNKSREGRFETVDEMIQAFRSVVLGGEIEQRPAAQTRVGMGDAPVTEVSPGESFDESDAQRPGKKRRRWPWVVGGIGVTFICLLAFLAFASSRNGDPEEPSPEPRSEEVQTERQLGSTLADLPSLEGVFDPQAHFERANRLEEADRPIMASQSYYKAGELFVNEVQYPEAVESLLRALELGGLAFERPERAEELFMQALFFMSAPLPIYEQVERARAIVPDWQELELFLARTEIYHGSPERAREIVTNYLAGRPEHPIAQAILAEIHMEAGEHDHARRLIAKGLENGRSSPEWLRDHLHWLESQLPS